MRQAAEAAVRHSMVVEASVERAFTVFTQGIGSWWPREYHLLEVDVAELIFEPRVGGYVYERGVDGRECRWARVLAYDPPHRVVISWDINPQWQLETDLTRTSEVEIRFRAESPTCTHVLLEHRALERHGPNWERLRDSVGGPGGWSLILLRFDERLGS